jgi:hypothetical protein
LPPHQLTQSDSLSLAQLSLEEQKEADHLSKVPPELLRRIYTLVGPRGSGLPLSRSLKVFHDEVKLKVRAIDCYNCLRKLMSLIINNPNLGEYVKALLIIVDEETGGKAPTAETLTKFFKSLSNLRSLTVMGATPIVSLILKPVFCRSKLQKLESLEITSSFPNRRHPFHPRHFEAISQYPSLTHFSLRCERSFDDYLHLSSPPSPVWSKHFSNLKSLDISGLRVDGLALRSILSGCEKLETLSLTDGSGEVDLGSVVEALPHLSSLSSVTLRSCRDKDESDRYDVAPLLAKTPTLNSLGLLGSFDTSSAAFLDTLFALPLHDISIGFTTPLLPEDVLPLFDPKHRHPTLRRLRLDNILAIRGISMDSLDEEEYESVYFDADGDPQMAEGWFPPQWTHGWSPEVVEQTCEAAEKVDVEVEGTTFEAAEIEEEFVEEVGRAESFWEFVAEQQALALEFEAYLASRRNARNRQVESETSEEEAVPVRRRLADVD